MNIDKFVSWYETLTKESLPQINEYYHDEMFFKDPFNELNSCRQVEVVFEEMFQNLVNPRFVIIDRIHQDNQLFLTWDFLFIIKNKEYCIHGSSHLKIEGDKVKYHRDYWDVGEEMLEKIPIIGFFYKQLKSKFSHN